MPLKRRLRLVVEPETLPMTTVKIAFATTDLKRVDQHFGAARGFAVYAVGPDSAYLLEAAQFGQLSQDGNEDKLIAKFSVLAGCAAVYCLEVGASAMRQLLALQVQPVKVDLPHNTIEALLADLQAQWRAGPSGWLAKALQQQQATDPNRFDALAGTGWSE